ncbi:uncharacterized protein BJ171DRAFT_533918 [Polychytrium aggregatum]|uniref:uncharacterized protein n=1 Tax=Polychytrium aggregatum TaxID=110093 RepID=UPI0022FE4257|nr:uncharacterized protein BJ171DRAFT_533918 [Polychytrium aggregatum]KAI9193072.1 hypothetical protein BJ171DRAFT_533918 [Polychytrium aggregatum]
MHASILSWESDSEPENNSRTPRFENSAPVVAVTDVDTDSPEQGSSAPAKVAGSVGLIEEQPAKSDVQDKEDVNDIFRNEAKRLEAYEDDIDLSDDDVARELGEPKTTSSDELGRYSISTKRTEEFEKDQEEGGASEDSASYGSQYDSDGNEVLKADQFQEFLELKSRLKDTNAFKSIELSGKGISRAKLALKAETERIKRETVIELPFRKGSMNMSTFLDKFKAPTVAPLPSVDPIRDFSSNADQASLSGNAVNDEFAVEVASQPIESIRPGLPDRVFDSPTIFADKDQLPRISIHAVPSDGPLQTPERSSQRKHVIVPADGEHKRNAKKFTTSVHPIRPLSKLSSSLRQTNLEHLNLAGDGPLDLHDNHDFDIEVCEIVDLRIRSKQAVKSDIPVAFQTIPQMAHMTRSPADILRERNNRLKKMAHDQMRERRLTEEAQCKARIEEKKAKKCTEQCTLSDNPEPLTEDLPTLLERTGQHSAPLESEDVFSSGQADTWPMDGLVTREDSADADGYSNSKSLDMRNHEGSKTADDDSTIDNTSTVPESQRLLASGLMHFNQVSMNERSTLGIGGTQPLDAPAANNPATTRIGTFDEDLSNPVESLAKRQFNQAGSICMPSLPKKGSLLHFFNTALPKSHPSETTGGLASAATRMPESSQFMSDELEQLLSAPFSETGDERTPALSARRRLNVSSMRDRDGYVLCDPPTQTYTTEGIPVTALAVDSAACEATQHISTNSAESLSRRQNKRSNLILDDDDEADGGYGDRDVKPVIDVFAPRSGSRRHDEARASEPAGRDGQAKRMKREHSISLGRSKRIFDLSDDEGSSLGNAPIIGNLLGDLHTTDADDEEDGVDENDDGATGTEAYHDSHEVSSSERTQTFDANGFLGLSNEAYMSRQQANHRAPVELASRRGEAVSWSSSQNLLMAESPMDPGLTLHRLHEAALYPTNAGSPRDSTFPIKPPQSVFIEGEAVEEEDEFMGIGGPDEDEDAQNDEPLVCSGDEDEIETFDDIIELHRQQMKERDDVETSELIKDVTSGSLHRRAMRRNREEVGKGLDLSDEESDEELLRIMRIQQRSLRDRKPRDGPESETDAFRRCFEIDNDRSAFFVEDDYMPVTNLRATLARQLSGISTTSSSSSAGAQTASNQHPLGSNLILKHRAAKPPLRQSSNVTNPEDEMADESLAGDDCVNDHGFSSPGALDVGDFERKAILTLLDESSSPHLRRKHLRPKKIAANPHSYMSRTLNTSLGFLREARGTASLAVTDPGSAPGFSKIEDLDIHGLGSPSGPSKKTSRRNMTFKVVTQKELDANAAAAAKALERDAERQPRSKGEIARSLASQTAFGRLPSKGNSKR